MTEDKAKVKAHEELAYEYLRDIIPPEWTVTRTDDQHERHDVTLSKGNFSVIAENKIREFDYENNPYGPYALVDVSKVEYLLKIDPNARIFSFFPKNNAIFSHHVKDCHKWKKDWVECKKNSFNNKKKWKYEYFLPTNDDYRVDTSINISDGLERLKKMIENYVNGEESI